MLEVVRAKEKVELCRGERGKREREGGGRREGGEGREKGKREGERGIGERS